MKNSINLNQPASAVLRDFLAWRKEEKNKNSYNFTNDENSTEFMCLGFSLCKILSDFNPVSEADFQVKADVLLEIIEHKLFNGNFEANAQNADAEDLMIYSIANQLKQSIGDKYNSFIQKRAA